MQYYGTMLPRIPVPIERKMKVQLLLHEASATRQHLTLLLCVARYDIVFVAQAVEECNLMLVHFLFFFWLRRPT